MRRPWLALLLFAASAAAFAQNFPNRPMRIVVPSVAGSSPDIRARQIAAKLSEQFGQPVIVENRPGANGLIAAREAVKAGPDGYTLFLALINNAIFDVLKPDPCCRLNRELMPVSRFTMTPLVMVVHPGLAARTLKEYLELAKAKPGELTYAAGGTGSISQLVGQSIRSQAGVRLLEVPYKGVNAELPDLQSGQVMTAFVVPQVVLAALKAGKLRALGVTSRQRLAILPDVPTLAEAGLAGIEALAWNGIFVPAGTPAAVVETLHRALVRAYRSPEIEAQLRATGSYAAADSPEEFAAFVREENEKWSRVIRSAGIRPD
ncbi:MAG TPA: tripartite tricarboxylate transporter substrate binding protein [Burkholderiales bacterium]|nr:tripartite tricarboxylate transporter substrate binding protein [Burkholderiales bacterium]